MRGLFWVIIGLLVLRIGWRLTKRLQSRQTTKATSKKPLSAWQKKFYTVHVFYSVNLKRLFRDKTALFFTFLFPLIFLLVFGSLNSGNKNINFKVAVINQSKTSFASTFDQQLRHNKAFDVDTNITTLSQAKDKMSRSQIDGIIILPKNFGAITPGQHYPSGQVNVLYSQSNSGTGQTLTTVLEGAVKAINAHFVSQQQPLVVNSQELNEKSLSSFDYTFTGLLGFAILGAGIFGPMNVFPELKKMGILRRIHTTPVRPWQYFLSVMVGNAIVGLLSLALMFVVAMILFHLKVVGNYLELAIFLAFGIVMILGIGLALGGWAKNERQVAPLGNIIVFPMMFLTGVFFPRFLMPQVLQNITNYMPLTPVIDGARLIATEGRSLLDLGSQLAIMAVWSVIIYAIAFRVFRWE